MSQKPIQPDFYQKIQNISRQDYTLEMFFVMKDKSIKRAKLHNFTSEKLAKNFLKILQDTINEDTEYRAIQELDDNSRENEYLYFENAIIYENIKYLLDYWNGKKEIKPANSLEKDIFGLFFKLSSVDDYILFYQQCYPISFVTKASFMSLFTEGEGSVFKQIDKDILNIFYKIDFLIDEDFFLVLNFNPLEKQFGYKEVILKEANDVIEIISALNFIENMELIKNNLDSTNAKKIRNTSKKVLEMFENHFDEVKKFIQTHSVLHKLRFDKNNQIKLNSKKEMKLLIKLLSNDYLHSLLTKENFDSLSKKNI